MHHYEGPTLIGPPDSNVPLLLYGVKRVTNGHRQQVPKYRGGLDKFDTVFPFVRSSLLWIPPENWSYFN